MIKYKEELLKQDAPEEAATDAAPVVTKEPERELTEKEKDALVREELAQLRANVLAKKKREKKKVCGCIQCMLYQVVCMLCVCVVCLYGRIPVVLVTNSSLTCCGINPPDSRYAPILNSQSPILPLPVEVRMAVDLGRTFSRVCDFMSVCMCVTVYAWRQSKAPSNSIW